jgi:hypothetical protein
MLKQLSNGLGLGKIFSDHRQETAKQADKAALATCGFFPASPVKVASSTESSQMVKTEVMYAHGAAEQNADAHSMLLSLYKRAYILTREEIPAIQRAAHTDNLSCGQVLLRRGRISTAFHRHSIEILVAYKQGKTTFEHAVEQCKRLYQAGRQAENQPRQQGQRLGELLIAARLIDENQLFDALEKSLNQSKLLGEVLVESGIILREALEISLAILPNMLKGKMSLQDAARRLRETTVLMAG